MFLRSEDWALMLYNKHPHVSGFTIVSHMFSRTMVSRKVMAAASAVRSLPLARWVPLQFFVCAVIYFLMFGGETYTRHGRFSTSGGAHITVVSTPKEFDTAPESIIRAQRNAINSWLAWEPTPQVILFTKAPVPSDIRQHPNVLIVSNFPENKFGTPLISGLFELAQSLAKTKDILYVNSDIMLSPQMTQAIATASTAGDRYLMVGQRCSFHFEETVTNFNLGFFETNLKKCSYDETYAIDYFGFTKSTFRDIPKFALGRMVWDQWLLYSALVDDVHMVDATKMVAALHMLHDYKHIKAAKTEWKKDNEKSYSGSEEFEENRRLGKQRWYFGQTCLARYELSQHGDLVDKRVLLRKYTKSPKPDGELARGVSLLVSVRLEEQGPLSDIVSRWTGPAVLLFHSPSELGTVLPLVNEVEKTFRPLAGRVKIMYLLGDRSGSESQNKKHYNMLLSSATTEHVLFLDSNMVPSSNLHEELMKNYDTISSNPDRCFALPVFGQPSATAPRPATKQQLLEQLQRGQTIALNDSLRPTHGAVNHQAWAEAGHWYPINYDYLFEAYCVLSLNRLPMFEEGPATKGFERMAYTFYLDQLGYDFQVVSGQFLIDTKRTSAEEDPQPEWQNRWYSYMFEFGKLHLS